MNEGLTCSHLGWVGGCIVFSALDCAKELQESGWLVVGPFDTCPILCFSGKKRLRPKKFKHVWPK